MKNDKQVRALLADALRVTPEEFEFQDMGTGKTNVYLHQRLVCTLEDIPAFETRPAEFTDEDVEEIKDVLENDDPDEEWGDADDAGDHYPDHHGEPWSDQDTAMAIEDYKSGEDIATTAEDLGRTPYAVVCRLQRQGILTASQQKAFSATGILIPVEYRGMALYGDSRSPDTSTKYLSKQSVLDWFKSYNGVIDANGMKFIIFETVGDDCKSYFVHHSQFRPEFMTTISMTGRFISNERLSVHGSAGRASLEAALSDGFGAKFTLEDIRTEERPY